MHVWREQARVADGQVRTRPRVSVIMVFFNAERFIEEAIESVFAQTYTDWELLLVDDGSTDASTAIARRYAEKHPERVRYLEHEAHENRGASAARNLGLREASGEYIAFLDADDVYLPHKLEEQVPLLDAHPEAGLLYGRSRLWFSWNGEQEELWREELTRPASRFDTVIPPPELFTLHLRDEHIYPTTCSVLIRRAAIEKVGGCEESFRDKYEDMTLFMKLLLHFPAYISSRCWDRYRRHPDSCWAVATRNGHYRSGQPYPSREAFMQWLERYLMSTGMMKSKAGEALKKELRLYRHPVGARPVLASRALKTRVVSWRERLADPHVRSHLLDRLQRLAERYLPIPMQGLLRYGLRRRPSPPVGWVRFGSLRRLTPISTYFGFERGTPIDRYYIEGFLARHAEDIQGRVLEIEEDTYTRRFGGSRVAAADVLYLVEGNPQATIVADLTQADHIPTDSFDCIILTQTLQYIYDFRAAVRTLYRILKPGGVLLATFPGIIQLDDDDSGASSQWSFTPSSARRVFGEVFPPEKVTVQGYGNVLVAISFLHGIATEELRKQELDYYDPSYVVSITVRAVRPGAPG